MTLTLELSPTEEARLGAAARRQGLAPDQILHGLMDEYLPPAEETDPMLALFAQWAEEDAQMTPEEIAEERRLWEQFEANVNETRGALGMRRL